MTRFERATGSSVDLVRIDDPLAAVPQENVDVALARGSVRSLRLQGVHFFAEDRAAVFAETSRSPVRRVFRSRPAFLPGTNGPVPRRFSEAALG